MKKFTYLMVLCLFFIGGLHLTAQTPVTVVEEDVVYAIKSISGASMSGLLLGDNGLGTDGDVTVAEAGDPIPDNQLFKFVATGKEYNGKQVFTVQVQSTQKFVYGTGWKSSWSDTGTEFWIDPIPGNEEGHVSIKKNNASNGFGLDDNNKHLYLDKSGDKNKWVIFEPVDPTPEQLLERARNAFLKTITVAEAVVPTVPTGLQSGFTTNIESAKTLAQTSQDIDVLKEERANLVIIIKEYEGLIAAIDNGKSVLEIEGDFDATKRDELIAAINAVESADAGSDVAQLLSSLSDAIQAYKESEVIPDFATITDGKEFRFFSADLETRGGKFFYPDYAGNRVGLKEGFSDDQLFRFRQVESGENTYIRIEPASSTLDSCIFLRGNNNHTARIGRIGSSDYSDAKANFTVRYIETKGGEQYFGFVANGWHTAVAVDGGVDQIKSRGSYGANWGETVYKFAILEDGKPLKALLKKGTVDAESFYAQTEEGLTDGKYPVAARELLATAIQAANAKYADETLTSDDQDAINAETSAIVAALQEYQNAVVVIDKSALEEKLLEATELREGKEVGDKNGQVSTQQALDDFDDAIVAAQAVFDESLETVKQSDIDAAIETLTTAIETFDGSIFHADFTALDALVAVTTAYADAIDAADGTELATALATFKAAIAAAPIEHDAAVTQTEIDAAVTTLQAAVEAFLPVLKTDLAAAIENADEYLETVGELPGEETDIDKAFATLEAAIDAARAINNSIELNVVTQPAIEAQLDLLPVAIETFDAAYLTFAAEGVTELIAKAQAKHDVSEEGTEVGQYEVGSKAELQTAIDAAKAAIDAVTSPYAEYFEGVYNTLNAAYELFLSKEKLDTKVDEFAANGISVYTINGKLYVAGISNEVSLIIYDMTGRAVFTDRISTPEYSCQLPSGNYIISVTGYVNGNRIVVVK